MLNLKELEHVGIEKVEQLFRDMLGWAAAILFREINLSLRPMVELRQRRGLVISCFGPSFAALQWRIDPFTVRRVLARRHSSVG
jgi:hypothetical protein